MTNIPSLRGGNLPRKKEKETSFLSTIVDSATNIFNGISDLFTGDSYKKTKKIRIEQILHKDGIQKLAIAHTEIREELDSIRKYIFESKNLFKETNSFMIKSSEFIEKIQELENLKVQLNNIQEFKIEEISYLKTFKTFKSEIENTIDEMKKLTNSFKKDVLVLVDSQIQLKKNLEQNSLISEILEQDMNVLNKNYKSLNNSLNENEKATTNLSKKLIDIFNNHNRELIKINASLVKANKSNQIKFQEFELNNSNQDIKIKELKDWLIYLTAFLLCVAIFYIVFSNI